MKSDQTEIQSRLGRPRKNVARLKWMSPSDTGVPRVKLTTEQRSAAMKKGWRTRRARLARAKKQDAKFNGLQVEPVVPTNPLNRPAKELRQIGLLYLRAAKWRRKLEQTLAPYI